MGGDNKSGSISADNEQVNCALEFFPEMALARAKELDEILKKTGKPVGPLHGLPISLKDQFRIKVRLSLCFYSRTFD